MSGAHKCRLSVAPVIGATVSSYTSGCGLGYTLSGALRTMSVLSVLRPRGESNSNHTQISVVYHLLIDMKHKDCTLIAVHLVNDSHGANIHPSRKSSVNLGHENVRNCDNANFSWECCQRGGNISVTPRS